MTHDEVTAAMKAEDVDAALVEKAARAQYAADPYIHLDDGPIGWDWLDDPDRQELLRGARHALAAVLPEIQAQALEEAATTVGREVDVVWPSPRHTDVAEAASYAAEVLRANARAAREGKPTPYAARLTAATGEKTT